MQPVSDMYALGEFLGSIIGSKYAKRQKEKENRLKSEKLANTIADLSNPTSAEKAYSYEAYQATAPELLATDEKGKYKTDKDGNYISRFNEKLLGKNTDFLDNLNNDRYETVYNTNTRLRGDSLNGLNPNSGGLMAESLKLNTPSLDQLQQGSMPKQETQALSSAAPNSLQQQPAQQNQSGLLNQYAPTFQELVQSEKYKSQPGVGLISGSIGYTPERISSDNLNDEEKGLLTSYATGEISKQHLEKFLETDKKLRQRYDKEVPTYYSYLSEKQMLEKALKNGYSLDEAKTLVDIARMDINKQQTDNLLGSYFENIKKNDNYSAFANILELSEYNPKMASALFAATANPKDLWGVDVARENALQANVWDNEKRTQQEGWNREDRAEEFEIALKKMKYGSELDVDSAARKRLNELLIAQKFGIGPFAPRNISQKVPQYARDLSVAGNKIKRALNEAGGDFDLSDENVKEAIDEYRDLYEKHKFDMDERDVSTYMYLPLIYRIDIAKAKGNGYLMEKLIQQLPSSLQKKFHVVEKETIGPRKGG